MIITLNKHLFAVNTKPALVSVDGDLKERACDSLIMCIVTTLNQGLRNGGGIGDILRAPSSNVSIDIMECMLINVTINISVTRMHSYEVSSKY